MKMRVANIQDRKLNIIEQLIIINDESVFDQIETIINNSLQRPNLKKFTKSELIHRAKLANLDIENDTQVVEVHIENRFICLTLMDGTEFSFPAANNKILANATNQQLINVELICDGTGLHWDDLDEDLSVDGILDGRFG